jgi:hypothetical protein
MSYNFIIYPEIIHLFPLAYEYSCTLIKPFARSLTSTVEFNGEGVGIPGNPAFKI